MTLTLFAVFLAFVAGVLSARALFHLATGFLTRQILRQQSGEMPLREPAWFRLWVFLFDIRED